MSGFRVWIETILHLTPDIELKLLSTITIVIVTMIIRQLIIRLINQQITERNQRYHWRKNASYLVSIVAIILIGRTWITGLQSLGTYLGLFSAGLAIALRTPLTSFVAWMYIVWQQPFVVGDRIQIGQHAGDVIDIGTFKFTLLEIGHWVEADQSTGRIMYVPNGEIFMKPLANFTTGLNYIWDEIQVTVTFESNWEAAKQLMTDIANNQAPDVSEAARNSIRKASRRFLIHYNDFTPIVYVKIKENGVGLTLRYLCPPRQRRGIEQELWQAILYAFKARADIEFAYPTQRFFSRHLELEADDTGKMPLSTPLDEPRIG